MNGTFSCFPSNVQCEDLSRMFRLFSKIPRGLDPVSSIFKQVGGIELIFMLFLPLIMLIYSKFWVLVFLLSSYLLSHLYLFPSSQHVTTEGMALVKHAEDAASNKKVCA